MHTRSRARAHTHTHAHSDRQREREREREGRRGGGGGGYRYGEITSVSLVSDNYKASVGMDVVVVRECPLPADDSIVLRFDPRVDETKQSLYIQ